MLAIFTVLSPFYVEQSHDKASALTKCLTMRCKSHLERSTAPNETDIIKTSMKALHQNISQRNLNLDVELFTNNPF